MIKGSIFFKQHAKFCLNHDSEMVILSNLESINLNFFPNGTNHGGAVRDIVAITLSFKDKMPFRQAPNPFIGFWEDLEQKSYLRLGANFF